MQIEDVGGKKSPRSRMEGFLSCLNGFLLYQEGEGGTFSTW